MAKPYYQDNLIQIWQRDCRRMDLPDKSVHCIVTSPPYWGLRKYQGEVSMIWDGWTGELGREPTPEMYLAHMVEICREFRRVLRDDGTIWLNMGDSMVGGKGQSGVKSQEYQTERVQKGLSLNRVQQLGGPGQTRVLDDLTTLRDSGLKALDLVGMPWRLALALQADGWILRCDGIWWKDNPMPESISGTRWEQHRVKVKAQRLGNGIYGREFKHGLSGQQADGNNTVHGEQAQWADCPGCERCLPNDGLVLRRGSWRPTKSHEYIFQFTKTDRYFSDQEAVREYNTTLPRVSHKLNIRKFGIGSRRERQQDGDTGYLNPTGRNLRSVWAFPTQPFRGFGKLDHFATFPEALPERCIKASTSEWGVCPKCGSQWARVLKREWKHQEQSPGMAAQDIEGNPMFRGGHHNDGLPYEGQTQTLGWHATCSCNAGDPVPATVLDPFLGSGTTLWVAKKLGRRSIGYDLSMDYVKLSLERNRQMGL